MPINRPVTPINRPVISINRPVILVDRPVYNRNGVRIDADLRNRRDLIEVLDVDHVKHSRQIGLRRCDRVRSASDQCVMTVRRYRDAFGVGGLPIRTSERDACNFGTRRVSQSSPEIDDRDVVQPIVRDDDSFAVGSPDGREWPAHHGWIVRTDKDASNLSSRQTLAGTVDVDDLVSSSALIDFSEQSERQIYE